jgi:hypothetical protein
MADEIVDIKIKFEAQTRELTKAIAQLSLLEKRVKKLSSGRGEALAQQSGSKLANTTKGWKRSFDAIDAGAKMAGKGLTKFLGMAIKGVVIEMAALGAAMIGVHALFAAGQLLVKAYRGAMQMLSAGAAGVVVAISAASAAIREQQAAIYAYRGKGAPAFGSAMNQTRMGMRNLQSDASLATLGVEALNKAYGTMSKSMNTAQINKSGASIKALMDFGSAGQDPAKGLEQVSIVIENLSNSKKSISDVITEAKKLGPEMEKALKGTTIKTKEQFKELLMSGQLADKGGVAGQFEAVNGTLISQMKGYFSRLRGEFADFGDQFLEPLKASFERVFGTIRRDLQRIMGAISYSFGATGIIDGFAGGIEKASNWLVKMIREYLPGALGMFDRIGDWFSKFKRGWDMVLEQTRPLIDGAKVLYKAFTPVWEAIKRGAGNLTLFKDLLVENKNEVAEFGERVGELIDSLSKFFMNLKKMFMDMLPFLSDLVSGLTSVFNMISKMFSGGAGGGLASALAPLLAFSIIGKKMSGVKGRLMPGVQTVKTMSVNAQNVSIGGKNLGPAGPTSSLASGRGGGGGGALSSGYPATSPVIMPGSVTGSKFRAISNDPNSKFFGSAKAGSRHQVALSGIDGRIVKRKEIDSRIGRGVVYAATGARARDPYADRGQITNPDGTTKPVNPNVNLPLSAKFRATQSLNARSMDELRQIATQKGIVGTQIGGVMGGGQQGPGAPRMSDTFADRKLLVKAIMAKKGSTAEFKNDGRTVSIGQGLANSAKRGALKAVGVADRGQYLARRGFGAIRGGFAQMNSGAWDAEKGEYKDLGTARGALLARRGESDKQGGLKKLGGRLSYRRDMNRISRNDSKFGGGVKKFNNSMGAKMGVGMGLGLASQYAPEEMQGAIALGGMVAQVNPMLGAAVAGIGSALKATSVKAGALAGAAGGAAAGAMFGPYGAAIGAGVGLLVGGIMGAVNAGKEKLKKAKKIIDASMASFFMIDLQKAGRQFQRNAETVKGGGSLKGRDAAMVGLGTSFGKTLGQFNRDITAAIAAGGGSYESNGKTEFNDAKGILDEYFKTDSGKKLTSEERDALKARATNSIRHIMKTSDPLIEAQLSRIDKQNTERIGALSRATGKSGAELEQLAKTLGVDLYDPTIKYNDLLLKFSGSLKKTGAELNDLIADIVLSGANAFKTQREKEEATYALDSNLRQLGDIMRDPSTTADEKTTAMRAHMEPAFNQLLQVAGGDGIMAYQGFIDLFGGKNADGKIFAPGAELAGQGETFVNDPIYQASVRDMEKGAVGAASEQLRTILSSEEHGNLKIEEGVLESQLTTLLQNNPEQFLKLLGDIKDYDLTYDDKDGLRQRLLNAPKGGAGAIPTGTLGLESAYNPALGAQSALSGYGMGELGLAKENTVALDDIATAATNMGTAATGLEEAIKIFNTNMEGFFTAPLGEMPDWWRNGLVMSDDGKTLAPPDTSTPRGGAIGDTSTSKLSQTMSRHAAMNGQLTGKRTVTSSLRNYALGSPSSDHATGSAYDLVGQNLGQYSKLVHANGGFAEFHGSAANRHLHVVPGPGVGDTSVARPISSATSGGGSTNNYYSIEVNGGNSSPEAIAQMVMAKLQDRERSEKERR